MGFVIRRFSSGELIDKKYLLMGSVGRGASGEVFQARNLLAGNLLALKLLVEEQRGDTATVQRFFREARAINRVGHPNIVQVFDAGFAESTPYIAMEFLSGESLARLLERKKRIDLASAAAILACVLDALAAAHKVNIIHRDLKPANIFLAAGPGKTVVVKLLDFGVAKMRDLGEESLCTSSGLILGTPDYLSPEQVTAESDLDGRSDLFAAGVLFFELLTGKRPFASPSFVTTTYRIVHEAAPLVSELGGPEDPAVLTILERALAKKRDARYANADEFIADLLALVPDAAEREEALKALDIVVSVGDTPWEFTPPALPKPNTPTHSERGETARPTRKGFASEGDKPSGEKTPSGSPSIRTWTDLPLMGRKKTGKEPARHVRGTVWRAMDRAITTRYGSDVREDMLRALPKKLRESLIVQDLHPDAWYSLSNLAEFVARSNEQVVRGEADKWRALGYACVETDLVTLVRSTRRQTDLLQVMRAAIPICADLFDFGLWNVEDDGGDLRVVIDNFYGVPASVLDWLSGVIEHAARSTGKSYRAVVIAAGTLPADPRVEFQINLR